MCSSLYRQTSIHTSMQETRSGYGYDSATCGICFRQSAGISAEATCLQLDVAPTNQPEATRRGMATGMAIDCARLVQVVAARCRVLFQSNYKQSIGRQRNKGLDIGSKLQSRVGVADPSHFK